jgi:hypothetical protein
MKLAATDPTINTPSKDISAVIIVPSTWFSADHRHFH